MKKMIHLFALLLIFPSLLLLSGCSGTSYGGGGSAHYGVYAGYGYPYYGYGYHDDIDINLPDRPDRPDRPNRPDRPSIQPVPSRPSGGMGRPSGGMPRGGGGGRRR